MDEKPKDHRETAKNPFKIRDFIERNSKGIVACLCLIVLFCSVLVAVKGSVVYILQNAVFNALHVPLEEITLNGHRFLFPPYFAYDIVLGFAAAFVLLGTFRKKTMPAHAGPRANILLAGYFILIIIIYSFQVFLFLSGSLYLLQALLWFAAAGMAGFYYYSLDKNRGVVIIKGGLLSKDEKWKLFIFAGAMLLVYMWDYGSWKYAFIGDEFAFYDEALGVAGGKIPLRLFYGDGVYGYHPCLASILAGAIMKISGTGLFGWKLSSAVFPAVSIVPLFMWAKLVFRKRTALITTSAFAFSLPVLAFSHIGYDNIQAVFPLVLSLLLAELALRKNSSLWSFAAGLAMGLGFYTFYSARLTVPVVGLYWFFHPLRKKLSFSSLAAGLIACGATILFTVISPGFIGNMLGQTVFGGSEVAAPAERPVYILLNFIHAFFSFIARAKATHFMSGPLIDWLTGAGVITGLAWALASFKKDWRARWIILSYILLVVFLGAIAKYKYPPNTRLYFMAPLLSVIAGVGLARLASCASFFRDNANKKYGIIILLITGLIAVNNIYRFYVSMPRAFPFTAESYVVKYMQEKPGGDRQYFVVTDEFFGAPGLWELYGPKKAPVFLEMAGFGRTLKRNRTWQGTYLFPYDAINAAPWLELSVRKENILFDRSGDPALYAFDIKTRQDLADLQGVFIPEPGHEAEKNISQVGK